MGLDMYLKANRYIGGWDHTPEDEKIKFRAVLEAAGMTGTPSPRCPSLEVQVNVAYWRKANAIHKWLIDHCNDGDDECHNIYVAREQLQELLNLCSSMKARRKEMEKEPDAEAVRKILPPQEGFFFGSTEIDEDYWDDIDMTIEQLEAVLKDERLAECDFYYRPSW